MMFMNEYEVDDAVRRFGHDPVLGPAARTLRNLVDVANHNSDGWAYWPKPCRAAAQLQRLLTGDGTMAYREEYVWQVTAAQVKKAYRPIKAFLTRTGLTCEIEVPMD